MKALTTILALFFALNLSASVDSIPTCVTWAGVPADFIDGADDLGFTDGSYAFDTLTFELYRDSLGTTIDTVTVYELRLLNDDGELRVPDGYCVIKRAAGLLFGNLLFYNEINRIYTESLPE